MYSEYCRLRDEVPGYVEVQDYGEEGDSWSYYDYTDPNYAGKMFNLYWDEIPIIRPDDEDTTNPDTESKFYATHAFKYCLEHNTLWFDEYVIQDRERLEHFMRFHRYGMKVVFVDGEDLEFNLDTMYDPNEKNLYDVPIHATYFDYGRGITYLENADDAIDLIEDCIDDRREIKRILKLYHNGTKLEERKYMVHELLELGYKQEELVVYMRYSNEYRRLYASMNVHMNSTLAYLLTGYYHWYYRIEELWNGTLREYYLSCPYIKEKKGSKLKSRPFKNEHPKNYMEKKIDYNMISRPYYCTNIYN